MMNRRDAYHEWACGVLAGLVAPLWTCEAVLTEAAHLVGDPRAVMGMIRSGFLRIGLDVEEQADGLHRLLEKYGPHMDFADACVVRMSEIHRDCRVITLDRKDFSVYRRNGRQVVPIVAPADR